MSVTTDKIQTLAHSISFNALEIEKDAPIFTATAKERMNNYYKVLQVRMNQLREALDELNTPVQQVV